ncbi:MAG: phosphohydrolase, partial [Thermus sp.]|nr:phosphohydrolase [Thermus sp.]
MFLTSKLPFWGKKPKLDLPPSKVLVLVLAAFLVFVVIECYFLLYFWEVPLWLDFWDLAFWAILIFWSVRLEVRLPLNASVSQLFIFALALMVLTPAWLAPLWVFLFQSSGNTWYKRLFNRSQDALATALATIVWVFFQQNPLYLGTLNLSAGVGIALAALTFFTVNIALVALAIHITTGSPLREVWRKNFAWLAFSYLLLSPLALLLARAYETPLIGNWGGWTVLFFLIPLY